jgi:murein L,D-transpeptidase YafK
MARFRENGSTRITRNLTKEHQVVVMKILAVRSFLGFLIGLSCLTGTAYQSRTSLARQKGQRSEALKLPLKDPRIVVLKSKRQLKLYSAGSLVRTYKVGLGLNPVDDKKRQGDRATPEGEFYIFVKNNKSAYYLSLGLSYPNVEDAERGVRDGLISQTQHDAIVKAIKRKATPPQNTALGGDIYIHGNGASSDWTWGCVALENEDMRELFDAVQVGTPVAIQH